MSEQEQQPIEKLQATWAERLGHIQIKLNVLQQAREIVGPKVDAEIAVFEQVGSNIQVMIKELNAALDEEKDIEADD